MTIRHDDGQFALVCYFSDAEDSAFNEEFSDTLGELRARAEVVLAAGRYPYLEIQRWNADAQDWYIVETFGDGT